jgi:hypothetical protein
VFIERDGNFPFMEQLLAQLAEARHAMHEGRTA